MMPAPGIGIGLGIGVGTLATSYTASGVYTGPAGEVVVLTKGAQPIDFYTNDILRARLDQFGALNIGATGSLGSAVRVQVSAAGAATEFGVGINVVAVTAGTTRAIEFQNSGAVAGSVTYASASSVVFNTTSDARLKDFTVPQRDWRPAIEAIVVRDFKWTADGVADFGVAAQQAAPHYPFAFTKPVKPDELWQADYSKLAPLALWGVKDLYGVLADALKRIEALEASQPKV
jgi:hypothetical protein